MKKLIKLVKFGFNRLTSYQAASKKFGYRLYSKDFIENSLN